MCVCVCVDKNFWTKWPWPRHWTHWLIFTLCRSSWKVNVVGQRSRLQEENVSEVVSATSNEGFLVSKEVGFAYSLANRHSRLTSAKNQDHRYQYCWTNCGRYVQFQSAGDIFRPHRSTAYVDAVYRLRPSSVVGLSVCLSVTLVSPADHIIFSVYHHNG